MFLFHKRGGPGHHRRRKTRAVGDHVALRAEQGAGQVIILAGHVDVGSYCEQVRFQAGISSRRSDGRKSRNFIRLRVHFDPRRIDRYRMSRIEPAKLFSASPSAFEIITAGVKKLERPPGAIGADASAI